MIDIHRLWFGAADQGQALPEHVRQRMELLLGTPFTDVRVHLSHLPRALGTRAFVHGSDLYFDPGHYDPESAAGWALIGHVLAHVKQARRGWRLAPEGVGVRVLVDPALEAEADRMAELARRAFAPETTLPVPQRRPAAPPRWDLVLA